MIVLITGISSGFGLAMARQFSEDGHIVYGTVRRDVEQIPGVHYLRADVRNNEQVREAVSTVISEQGYIDVLVNNAGMGIGGPVEFTSEENFTLQMDTNFLGQVRFAQAVLPYMRRRREGRIIFFSSIGGIMGLPYQGFYSASKFAVEGFAEALQIETNQFGLKMIIVEPGDFATGFTAARKKNLTQEAIEAYPGCNVSVESFESDEKKGLKPEYLARQVVKIATSSHPKFRYRIATFIQKLSLPLKVILPGRTFSKVLGWFYKM